MANGGEPEYMTKLVSVFSSLSTLVSLLLQPQIIDLICFGRSNTAPLLS